MKIQKVQGNYYANVIGRDALCISKSLCSPKWSASKIIVRLSLQEILQVSLVSMSVSAQFLQCIEEIY